jgi:glutathione peroxidase
VTIRQKILKLVYPLFLLYKKIISGRPVVENKDSVKPPVSFYSLKTQLINGEKLSFEKLKGKKVLIVNTASDCGFTNQYADLQKLYQHSKEDLEIIAFPANDFKQQEKGTNEEIEKFCVSNYFVRFKLAKKTQVVKGNSQDPVFQWLSNKENNGWNDRAPVWNFTKYLLNEEGVLTHYFEPAVSPVSEEVIRAVHS